MLRTEGDGHSASMWPRVRGTWMPSVLTEGLFMILPDQEAALRDPRGQQLYALAVFEGIRNFLRQRAREGFPILCSEPTAALMLRHDALDLTDDPDARLVAERTVELTAFLWELHREGRLRVVRRPQC